MDHPGTPWGGLGWLPGPWEGGGGAGHLWGGSPPPPLENYEPLNWECRFAIGRICRLKS
jgi:hypothetical protein